jgi:UDP-N-acetylglucosamine:LPS N-acetylglucosamine transferase
MTDRHQPDEAARRIAFFISPHGFGHAARAASIMEALAQIAPSFQFDIFSTVPRWFFAKCNSFAFQYHRLLTDIGLVQQTPFQEDLRATVQKLKKLLPFKASRIAAAAETIRRLKCKLVICDIAPMGIRVAEAAGVPSVLIENFTWDWIYRGYATEGLKKFDAYLQTIFAEATFHIQTQPICQSADVDFTAGPASRKPKNPSRPTRLRLGLSESCKVVVITAGGVPKRYGFIDKLKDQTDIHFIIPGAGSVEEIQDNLILLPENSAYFQPDLINAANAVIGKAGYSTIAEVYHAGVPFGYVARSDYRESKPLVDFIEKNIKGFAISESEFETGMFVRHLEKLLEISTIQRNLANGADQIAAYITDQIMKQT